jgi:hypothetical protein
VDIERRSTRKVDYNTRGVVGLRCNLNLRHYRKTHCSGFASMSRIPKSALELDIVCFTIEFLSRYQSDSMAAPAKRLIRRFESYPRLQI